MFKKTIVSLFLFFSVSAVTAQYGSLSPAAEISILTIGPGSELYDKFGHSGFRIKDSLAGVDVVFNYGIYDFEAPNFYLNFARGKLLYQVGAGYFHVFLESYKAENRWVKEQILNLNREEKQLVADYLWNNVLPENKDYLYDFFYDNCATKIRDVLLESLGNKIEYRSSYEDLGGRKTFRELIQQNLDRNTWGSLGIDIALGAVIDRDASPFEYQFLPEYIFEAAADAVIHRNGETTPLVSETKTLFENKPRPEKNNFFFSPVFVLGIFSVLIAGLTFRDIKRKKRNSRLDFILFLMTGLIGLLLFLLWVGTDHTATARNYNLLWAFPVSLFLVTAITKKQLSSGLKRYIFFLIVMLALVGLHWITGVQDFAPALAPVCIALAFRYIYLLTFKNNPVSEKS